MPPKKSDLKNLYFEHEFGSRKGTTLTEITKNYGLEGVGVFWCLVEMFYEKNGVIEQNDVEMFAWQVRAEVDIFDRIIDKYFKREDDGKIYAPNVIERIKEREQKLLQKSAKARESAKARWDNLKIIDDSPAAKSKSNDLKKEDLDKLQDALNKKYGKKKKDN